MTRDLPLPQDFSSLPRLASLSSFTYAVSLSVTVNEKLIEKSSKSTLSLFLAYRVIYPQETRSKRKEEIQRSTLPREVRPDEVFIGRGRIYPLVGGTFVRLQDSLNASKISVQIP